MITAVTAPARGKVSKFEVVSIKASAQGSSIEVHIYDESQRRLTESPIHLANDGFRWMGINYAPTGEAQTFVAPSAPNSIVTDIQSFLTASGSFQARFSAVEAELVRTGRLPT